MNLDSLPPQAKIALMQELGALQARMGSAETRMDRLETRTEDTGRHELVRLREELQKRDEQQVWKKRTLVTAGLGVLGSIVAAVLTYLVTG